jgi:transposase
MSHFITFVGIMQVIRRGVAPKETRKLIEEKGCKLIYLPPYSPDLNKIENYWAIIKRYEKNISNIFRLLKTVFPLFLTLSFLLIYSSLYRYYTIVGSLIFAQKLSLFLMVFL